MDSIVGMTPTGRRIGGPSADLVEVESDKGLKHTAIVYHDEFVEHPTLLGDLKEFGKFMEKPGITGLAELTAKDNETGAYVYPTGTVWSVAEVVRAYNDLGEACGIRAGLEVAYVASQILIEAEEKASKYELFNHGSLDPWRVMVKSDGQLVIIGYGFPQVEIMDFLEDETLLPKEDSFRYAPPERLEDEGEDLGSDLFSLALVALEVMVGKPVYDGLVNDIRQQATRAEGAYRLHKWRNQIPEAVRDALGRAIKYDPDARYPNATEFTFAMHDLLGSLDAEGPSLLEVMKRVKSVGQKGKALIGGRTAALSKEDLARMAAEFDDDDEGGDIPALRFSRPDEEPEPEEEPEQPQRWGKATRTGRRSAPDRGKKERSGGRTARSTRTPPRERERSREIRRSSRSGDLRQRQRSRDSGGRDDDEGSAKESLRDSLKKRMRESGERLKRSGGERTSRASRGRDESKPEEKTEMAGGEEDAKSSGGAAALLARLRSSAGVKTSGSKPAELSAPRAEKRREEGRAPMAAAGPASGARKSTRTSSGDRDEDEKLTFEVVADGHSSKVKIRLGDTVAEAADRLLHALSVIPTDLSGNLKGWYRFEQDDEWFPGHETADILDPDKEVVLAFVPNRVIPMNIEVEGVDPPARFQAPVGTAVPSQSLVQHLQGVFDLPDEDWAVFVDDEPLDPLQILEDFEPGRGFSLVVKS
jgi:hypothetical protein